MLKTYTAKTPPDDFKVTALENSLLSQQAVTSKEISVPYTNLQLNPYPIPNWTCLVVIISHFQCIAPSDWSSDVCSSDLTSPIGYWGKGSTIGWYKVLRFLYL